MADRVTSPLFWQPTSPYVLTEGEGERDERREGEVRPANMEIKVPYAPELDCVDLGAKGRRRGHSRSINCVFYVGESEREKKKREREREK